jgi:MFS family permease
MSHVLPAHQKISSLAYVIFLLGSLFYFYEYALQISPSIMTHELMRDLHIDASTLGTVSAFYYYTYTLFQVPAGLLYDRFGARAILTTTVLICALGAVCFGATNSIILISLGRLLMGAGSAFAFVGTLYLILRWFPPHYFPILAGFTQMMGSMGAIFGAAPLAALNHKLGWHTSILSIAAAGFILALLMFVFVRNQPGMERALKTKNKVSMRKNLLTVISNKSTWPLAFYSCFVWAPIAAFAGLWGVPFLAAKFQLTTVGAAQMIAAIWIGVSIGAPSIGFISEKLKMRRPLLILMSLIGVICTSTIIYLPHEPSFAACLLLFGLGVAASGQSLVFAVITDINSIETTSAAIGFNNMCIVCGAIFFQPFIGRLLDLNWNGTMLHSVPFYTQHDYQIAFTALPLCYLACFLCSVFLIKESYFKRRSAIFSKPSD